MERMDDERKPDWLTEMDEEILEVMSTGLMLGPTAIAENIDRSREGVSNRLNSLQAGGLVEKIERGKYEITDEGYRIYVGAPEGLESPSDAARIGAYREDVEERRRVRRDLGVSLDEFHHQLTKEVRKIKSEEPDCENPYEEASKRVARRLREEKQN